MIRKYTFGIPFKTDAVVVDMSAAPLPLPLFNTKEENGLTFTYQMNPNDVVYGLGENIRGMNKRGFLYNSLCSDIPSQTEDKTALYGAHNFLIVAGKKPFGLFIDCPEQISFDVGYTDYNSLVIATAAADLDFYLLEEKTLKEIAHAFRVLIGKSYIPPKWGLGYQQSRWGYKNERDFYEVVERHQEKDIPLEAVYMDIDYMERFKDFTIDEEAFPNFDIMVADFKEKGIKLVPIIDAGVKIEEGYDIYEEGVENHYFCTDKSGQPFTAAVWPGRVHLPDVLNPEARKWFGNKYKFLTDKGIEGFWNDMNEPAIFYTEEGLKEAFDYLDSIHDANIGIYECFGMKDAVLNLANNPKDYARFYHYVNGEKIVHTKLHNLYGFNMTRAAAEGFEEIDPSKRFLLFSRSSYIGMHRYGGIWTGDNCSWWQHLVMNIKMMPSLNMCGFLYSGADLGGFGCDTSYDLLTRWLQFGIFTPLMRNHSALGTRPQELYQFEDSGYLRSLIRFRYSLIPYLYSEYMKCALRNELLFMPLGFEYTGDSIAAHTEDQLLYGSSLMLAPVYTQNAFGRYVYLPEDMLYVKYSGTGGRHFCVLDKGIHYLELTLEEFPLFIRRNQMLLLCHPDNTTETLDSSNLEIIAFADKSDYMSYELYDDDGYTKNIDLQKSSKIVLRKTAGKWGASSDNPHITFFDIHVITKQI